MHILLLASFLIAVSVLPSAAQCPVVNGVRLPCSQEETKRPAMPSDTMAPIPPMPHPLFTPDIVAKDMAPEYLALLNNPTWEQALHSAQVHLYRLYVGWVTKDIWVAAQQAIIHEVETKTGLTMKSNFDAFLQAFVKMSGFPIIDLADIPKLHDALGIENETARLLAEQLHKGHPTP